MAGTRINRANAACGCAQERARKLRIFPDEEHPFAEHPALVPWQVPPRRRRVREPLFQLPEGFQPLNPTAYRKRFGHMLPEADMARLFEPQPNVTIPAIKPEGA